MELTLPYLILTFFSLFLSALPAEARSRVVYACGCTEELGTRDRSKWELIHGWELGAVREATEAACNDRFGQGAVRVLCTKDIMRGKELATTEAKQNARLARNRAANRAAQAQARREDAEEQRRYLEGARRGNAAIDEIKRRQREDEIDRVLKEARERRNH